MSLRVVFMGTPDFAVTALKGIMESDHEVVGVVTNVDKPAGRGKKLNASAVKTHALAAGLPILQPERLKDLAFIADLAAWNADVFVVVAFRMLPKEVWSLPPRGTFNLHASLLPNYRGAAPINWAIIHGEKTTGVTTFLIDEKIDTGAILLKKEVRIEENETAGTLHDKLAEEGKELIIATLNGLEAGLESQHQVTTGHEKEAPKLNKSNTKINWRQSLPAIVNQIHGLSPFPGAWTMVNQNEQSTFVLKIFRATFETTSHQWPMGSIVVEKKQLKIALDGGFVICHEIQLPNKRRMMAKEALNGFSFGASDTVDG